jgi:glycosyltransferase involved in cell wall biosynthesis
VRLAGVKKRFAIEHLLLPADSNRGLLRHIFAFTTGHANLRLSASAFQAIICVSDALRHALASQCSFPEKKMRTIHNGVSLSEFSPSSSETKDARERFGIGDDEFVLVCPARLSSQKGIDLLLHALALCKRRGLRFRCMIVGDGPLADRLRRDSQELQLSDCVTFEGFKEDVRPYLHAANALVLTSCAEGLPLAILEAMACGRLCIVTNVGGNAEAVTNKVNGLVIPSGSVDAAAEAIAYVATHPTESAEMSRMARVKACEAFDIEKSMSDIRQVILS